ncbi:MAG: phthalate 4,5-dioxygenase [Alphaproteobacteria bacterium]|jgi:phenylpropionate dioxygenase-like ring-hydroxylating dioxygenase large terminal subunit|nr:phthalate 4,5-dioxygenase [Alphaproteobacteria bacterium]
MLTDEQNEFVTRTGPGTPTGTLFRRYWIPIMQSSELPEPECPPVRIKLLSERLLAFRDTNGKLGLIDEFCAHRGVSLWFGRNEEGGLRCPYHGWKYAVTGECLEVPSEPAESGFCKKIKLKSYPCRERGGIIWTYMGPPEREPAFPAFEWSMLPADHLYISKRWQECNYLQAMEGGIDSSHVSFLHSGDLHSDPLHKGTKGAQYQQDRKPKFEVVESPGGLYIGARRNAEEGHHYWRITQWIMPWYTMVPPYGDNALNGHAWVPIDDENCFTWTFTYHPTRPLSELELSTMRQGGGIHVPLIPGTFRPVINKDNDYLMDRAAQKAGRTYCGVKGIAMQDASVQESMGPLQDRSKENLASTDNAIIMARHRLRRAALALEKGIEPPGLIPETHRVRSATFVLPIGVAFDKAMAGALKVKEGVPHTSI